MTYVVDKVEIGQVDLRVLWFPLVNIIPEFLHTHFHVNITFIRRTSGRLGTFAYEGARERKALSLSFVFESFNTARIHSTLRVQAEQRNATDIYTVTNFIICQLRHYC